MNALVRKAVERKKQKAISAKEGKGKFQVGTSELKKETVPVVTIVEKLVQKSSRVPHPERGILLKILAPKASLPRVVKLGP